VPEGFTGVGDNHFDEGFFQLDHQKVQQPYRENRNREENASYCSGTIMRIAEILPSWTALAVS